MTALFFIPFAVFFGCILAVFYLLRGVRRALVEGHPEVWREISMNAWFIDQAVGRFVWGGRAKALNDPNLMQAVNRLRLAYAVAFAAWLTFAGLIVTSGLGGGR